MKNRFIVLIDFSEYSANLIKYACDWGKDFNAELLLVHQTSVLAPAFTDVDSRHKIVQKTNENALQKLEAIATDLIPVSMKVSFSVSENNLQSTLHKHLSDDFDNLIFVGIKGTGLLKKIFLGSVALQLIENTNNIIVAMPKEVVSFSLNTIYVGVTENDPLNLSEFNRLLKFLDNAKTTLLFFYLAEPLEQTNNIEKYLIELTELYADRLKTTYAIYEGNNPFDDIKKIINNKFDEIMVVQRGSRLLTDQLFRNFLINDLIYEGHIPLIVLP